MGTNFANAGIYLVQTFFGLYAMIIMVRLLMQVARVDYYNPICQGIMRVTDPVVRPFRSFLPVLLGVDFSSLAAAFLVQLAGVMLIMLLSGQLLFHPIYLAWVLLGLFSIIFTVYFFALIVMVISSWIAPYSSHPALTLVHQLVEPICMPARKLLPPMGGIDFSIILVFVAINIIDEFLVIGPLAAYIGVPRGIILGL